MESLEKKFILLKRIANAFNSEGIVWALGASMLLYLKSITSDFHDIDLMVTNEDVDRAKEILLSMGQLQPPNPHASYKTRTFLEFVIDGIDVDVMAGFVIVKDGISYDCSLHEDQIVEYHNLDGEAIPLQSVGLWCHYYELMGRNAKVEMIRKFFEKEDWKNLEIGICRSGGRF